jgi:hypothetical protein
LRSFLSSAIIHGILLALLIASQSLSSTGEGDSEDQGDKGKGGYPEQPIIAEIIDKPVETKDNDPEELTAPPDKDGIEAPMEPTHLDESCPEFFGGIGILQMYVYTPPNTGYFIQQVYRRYPAWYAGVQEGDKLLNHSEIRGPIGSKFILMLERNGVRLDIPIIRDKICTEEISR